MYLFHRFLLHETGNGREDWMVLSALAAALTTFIALWISSGGSDQITGSLRGIISDAVNDIGSDAGAPPP